MTSNTSWAHSDANFNANNNPPPGEEGWNRGNTPQNNPANWPQLGVGEKEHDQLAGMMSRVKIQNQQPDEPNWANSKPESDPSFHGWGKPMEGNPNVPNQANSGWGAPAGWGQSSPSNIDNGTAVWGKSTLQDTGSGWGNHQVGNAAPTNKTPTSACGETPTSTMQSNQQQQQQQQQAPQEVPTAVVTPNVNQPTSVDSSTTSTITQSTTVEANLQQQPQSETEKQPVPANAEQPTPPNAVHPAELPVVASNTNQETTDPVTQYVNSHEGWGKTPISQNSSWDTNENLYASHRPGFNQISNGTEAWGKPSAGQLPPTGNWGNDNMQSKKHSNSSHWGGGGGGNNYSGQNNNNWGANNQSGYNNHGANQNYGGGGGGGWNDQRSNQPNNDRWADQMNQSNHGGNNWGAQPINQKTSWANQDRMQENNRMWNMGKNSRFGPSGGSNTWGNQGMQPPPPQQQQQQQPSMDNCYRPDMQMNSRRPVDDGTGAWGDPSSYQEVHMWNNVRNAQSMDLTPPGNNPNNSSKGWGGMPSANQPPKGGWGDSSRPIDNGTSVWTMPNKQQHQQQQPLDKGGDWMKQHTDSQVWNQPSKSSGAGGWGQTGDYGDNAGPGGWGQQKGYPKGNLDYHMPMNRSGLNRQNPINQQHQNNVAPPPSPQLHSVFQQAVQNGIIPPNVLHPSLMMNANHVTNLISLVTKSNDLRELQSRVQLLSSNKMNGQNVRSHEMELTRMIHSTRQQLDAIRNLVLASGKTPNKMAQNNHDVSTGLRQQMPSMGNVLQNLGQQAGASWKQPVKDSSKMPQQPNYPTDNNAMRMSSLNNYMLPQDAVSPDHNKMMDAVGKYDHGLDVKDNVGNNSSPQLADIGPPEFTPGVPWPGLRPIDPETDPNITPGSAAQIKSISVVNKVSDADQLLSKRERGALSDSSAGGNSTNGVLPGGMNPNDPNEVFAHVQNSSNDRWSNQGCWLVLTNFTTGVDAEAVKEMCLRHGHVMTFQAHYPIENMALIRYSCQEEAAVAKKAMHITRVGNVMLLASVATDQEVDNFHSLSNGGAWAAGGTPNNRGYAPSTGTTGGYVAQAAHPAAASSRPAAPERMVSPVSGGNSYMWSMSSSVVPSASWPTSTHPQQSIPWSGGQSMEENSRLMSPIHSLLPENLLGSEIM